MIFIYLWILFFLIGILLGVTTAKYTIKKKSFYSSLIFIPCLVLNFFSINNPFISDIRYYLFGLVSGLVIYWVVYEINYKKKLEY